MGICEHEKEEPPFAEKEEPPFAEPPFAEKEEPPSKNLLLQKKNMLNPKID